MQKIFSVLITSLFLHSSVCAQLSQIDVSAKIEVHAEDEQTIYVQSLDAKQTCKIKAVYLFTGNAIRSVEFEIDQCDQLLQDIDQRLFFDKIEYSNTLIYLENEKYSARIQYDKSNAVKYLQKIVLKDSNTVVYNFNYNNFGVLKNTEEPNPSVEKKNPPKKKITNSSKNLHVVQKGEYIYQIARIYDCDPSELLAKNSLSRNTLLYPGQKIWVCNTALNSSESKTEIVGTPKAELQQDQVTNQNNSLKVYAEEMKEEYELLYKEYTVLQKSYKALSKEYKQNAEELKMLQEQNTALKLLLDQNQINYSPHFNDQDLSDEQADQIKSLKQKIFDMKSKINDLKIEVEDSQTDEKEDRSDVIFSRFISHVTENCMNDPGFKSLVLENRFQARLKRSKITQATLLESIVSEAKSAYSSSFSDQDFIDSNALKMIHQLLIEKNTDAQPVLRLFSDVKKVSFSYVKKDQGYTTKDKSKDITQEDQVLIDRYLNHPANASQVAEKGKKTLLLGRFELKTLSLEQGLETLYSQKTIKEVQ